jgi:hypothetical protein
MGESLKDKLYEEAAGVWGCLGFSAMVLGGLSVIGSGVIYVVGDNDLAGDVFKYGSITFGSGLVGLAVGSVLFHKSSLFEPSRTSKDPNDYF